jgi:hypothetical protein
MLSRIDALRQLHPEIESDEEALERLIRVREIEQILARLEDGGPGLPTEAEEG